MPSINHGEKLQAERFDGKKVDVAEVSSDNFLHLGRQDGESNGTHVGAKANGNGGILFRSGQAYAMDLMLPVQPDGSIVITGSDGKQYALTVTEVTG